MTPADPLAILLHDYGWAGVLIWLLVRDVWPFIKEHVFPAAIEERRRRLEITSKLEERQAEAMETIAHAVNEIKLAMVATNERLLDMRMAQADHHKATSDAITLMRERTKPGEKKPARQGGS